VCYDAGGTVPTITDASVVLGLLNPNHLVGGGLRLNAEKATAVFAAKIARPLGLELAAAALGAHRIAASNMMRAIRAVSSERGRDPRQYALVAFGGNGPLFACGIAQALGMARVIVPPHPGLFSAFGLLHAEVAYHHSRSLRRLLRRADVREIDAAFQALQQQAAAHFAHLGAPRFERSAALHYKGQSFELVLPVADGAFDAGALTRLEEAFGQEHEKTYGHRAGPDEPVELVSVQVVAKGGAAGAGMPRRLLPATAAAPSQRARRAYFGEPHGWMSTPVVARRELTTRRMGPLIVEEYDATSVVPPGTAASLDADGSIVIDLP